LKIWSCGVSFIVFLSATQNTKKKTPEKAFKGLFSGFLSKIFVA